MNITFWPVEFQEYLRKRYYYDSENGVVMFNPAHVGKRAGGTQVGTKSAHGYFTNVWFANRQWGIQMHKLAVFLHTGKQYRKLVYSDGDCTNLKIENLLAFQEITEEDVQYKQKAEPIIKQIEQHVVKNTPVTFKREDSVQPAYITLPTKTGPVDKVGVPLSSSDEEKTKRSYDESVLTENIMLRLCLSKYWPAGYEIMSEIQKEEHAAIMNYGLFTGMTLMELRMFVTFHSPTYGVTPDTYDINVTYVEDHDTQIKKDFFQACKWLRHIERHLFTEENVEQLLHLYTLNGEQRPAPPRYTREHINKLVAEREAALMKTVGEHKVEEPEFILYCIRHGIHFVDNPLT